VSQAERAPARSIVTRIHTFTRTFDPLSGCRCTYVHEDAGERRFPRGEGLLERRSCSSRANPSSLVSLTESGRRPCIEKAARSFRTYIARSDPATDRSSRESCRASCPPRSCLLASLLSFLFAPRSVSRLRLVLPSLFGSLSGKCPVSLIRTVYRAERALLIHALPKALPCTKQPPG